MASPSQDARSRFANRRVIFGAIAVALAAAAIFLLTRGGGEPATAGAVPGAGAGARAPAVTLAAVRFAPIEQKLTAIGTGRALQSLTLNAEVAGVIEAISIQPGLQVEAGAALVELEKDQQEIALAKARADYAIARTNAQRFEELVADEAASALEFEAARNELTAANAALRQAEFELSRRTITAPFAGVLGLTTLDIGDYLTVGAPVTTIDDITSVLVDFTIPEGASAYVEPGIRIEATAQASAGRTFVGEIRAVDSRIDPASRTRRVEAVLNNEDLALIPGSTFSIALDAPGRQAVVAPGLAIQWDRAGAYVWKVGAGNLAERVPVVILQRTADAVLVEASLQEGDFIVAEGADVVRAGAPLPDPTARAASTPASSSAVYQ